MNWNPVREPRLGVMLHYSAGSFDGTVAWCRNAKSGVSYHYVVDNTGKVALVAPLASRAWHAGVCRASTPQLPYRDANSAFYAIAVALGPGDLASPTAVRTIAALCRMLFERHRWPLDQSWRITGHGDEAWPRGRKVDPIGPDPDAPVLHPAWVRALLAVTAPWSA